MKKRILFTLLVASVAAIPSLHAVDFLTLNVQKAYSEFERAQDAETKFQSSLENARELETNMKQELQQIREEIGDLMTKANSDSVSEEGKAQLEGDIETRKTTFQEKNEELRAYLQDQSSMLKTRLQGIREFHLNEIKEVSRKIASDRGVKLVLNTSNINSVVYADESLDITEDVVAALNQTKE